MRLRHVILWRAPLVSGVARCDTLFAVRALVRADVVVARACEFDVPKRDVVVRSTGLVETTRCDDVVREFDAPSRTAAVAPDAINIEYAIKIRILLISDISLANYGILEQGKNVSFIHHDFVPGDVWCDVMIWF